MALAGSLILLLATGLAGQGEPPDGRAAGRVRGAAVLRERSVSRPGEVPRVVVTAVVSAASGVGALPAESLKAALERGLAAGGLGVIAHRRVDAVLSRHPHLRSCRSQACRERLGRILEAPWCAEVGLQEEGSGLRVTVSVVACSTGAPLSIRTTRRRVGTPELVAEAVARLAEDTAAEAAERAARAPVSGRPGAVRSLPAAGERSRACGRSALCWSGLSLLGAGLVAVTAGGALWGLDGRVYDRRQALERVYKTQTGGIVLTSLGIGALVGGVAMAVVAWRRAASPGAAQTRASAPPSLTVTVDPARRVVELSGSF